MEAFNQTLIIPEKLGERIKSLRMENGLSQAQVADDFITVRTLQKIERGETTPTFEVLLHIANKLKIQMFDLVLSSRIPYYLEYQFPTILRSVLSLIDNESSPIATEIFKDFTLLLEEFNKIKLPYEEQQRIETIYAILLAFTHKQKDAALNILGSLVEQLFDNLDMNDELQPDDTQLFQIAAYMRLEHDDARIHRFLTQLATHPQFYFHPTIAYNIGLYFYKKNDWDNLATISKESIEHLDLDTSYALLPFLYCQLGVAEYKKENDKGVQFFEMGVELLVYYRQKEHFDLMMAQAKNDNIPIRNVKYIDLLSLLDE